MGAKITIDSSTLMNKGLEVIEAHELFGVDFDAIDVVVHPQSVVHGMVEFVDGATIAQLSMPDMRLPIGLALGAPDRLPEAFGAIDWTTLGTLTFEAPDRETFRALDLAYAAGRTGGTAPAVLSAANEVAVEAFLGGPHRLADDRRDRRRSARRTAPGTPKRSQTFSMRTGSRASGPPRLIGRQERRVKDPLEQVEVPVIRPRYWIAMFIGGARDRARCCSRGAVAIVAVILALPDHHLPARARALRHRQAHGHEGHRVLRRLRAAHLVGARRARPSTASRRSRSAATARSSG